MREFVIGVDFGTDSVRAVLIDAGNGREQAAHVHWYKRWGDGKYCDPAINQYRQHPLDHIEGLEAAVSQVVKNGDVRASQVKGICIDTTGSSPVPVFEDGRPLALVEGFEENPHAMMILWKDHTAIQEAAEINTLAKSWGGEDFTKYEGGIYSSEWFWAKILHTIRKDQTVYESAWTWMEHCDLMTFMLTSSEDMLAFRRSRCAAGHKAMWHSDWGGLPPDEFLGKLDPRLVSLKKNLYTDTYTSDQAAGTLNKAWAERLGLDESTVVAVGTFDAHAGAVGAEAKENILIRVMGTSTCDIIVASEDVLGSKAVKGICGQVDGSVIPGMVGLEAGQSAFGDLLAWFGEILTWPLEHLVGSSGIISGAQKEQLIEEAKDRMLRELSAQAEKIPVTATGPVALDWINGRRTPDANQSLKAGIINLNLGVKAPHLFRALVEAICFGSRKIVERFEAEGVRIDAIVGIGGVAKKSAFIMQTLADVLNRPIKAAAAAQAPALGAAMYAAVAAGIYKDVTEAGAKMGSGYEAEYLPQPDRVAVYQDLYLNYEQLGRFVSDMEEDKNK